MYDAREKAIRDRKWELNAAFRQGKREGKIELIRTLQGLIYAPVSEEQDLCARNVEELEALATSLQEQMRSRKSE